MFRNSQHLPKGKERDLKSYWERVNFVLAIMNVTLNWCVALQCQGAQFSCFAITAFKSQHSDSCVKFLVKFRKVLTLSIYQRFTCCKRNNVLKVSRCFLIYPLYFSSYVCVCLQNLLFHLRISDWRPKTLLKCFLFTPPHDRLIMARVCRILLISSRTCQNLNFLYSIIAYFL